MVGSAYSYIGAPVVPAPLLLSAPSSVAPSLLAAAIEIEANTTLLSTYSFISGEAAIFFVYVFSSFVILFVSPYGRQRLKYFELLAGFIAVCFSAASLFAGTATAINDLERVIATVIASSSVLALLFGTAVFAVLDYADYLRYASVFIASVLPRKLLLREIQKQASPDSLLKATGGSKKEVQVRVRERQRSTSIEKKKRSFFSRFRKGFNDASSSTRGAGGGKSLIKAAKGTLKAAYKTRYQRIVDRNPALRFVDSVDGLTHGVLRLSLSLWKRAMGRELVAPEEEELMLIGGIPLSFLLPFNGSVRPKHGAAVVPVEEETDQVLDYLQQNTGFALKRPELSDSFRRKGNVIEVGTETTSEVSQDRDDGNNREQEFPSAELRRNILLWRGKAEFFSSLSGELGVDADPSRAYRLEAVQRIMKERYVKDKQQVSYSFLFDLLMVQLCSYLFIIVCVYVCLERWLRWSF